MQEPIEPSGSESTLPPPPSLAARFLAVFSASPQAFIRPFSAPVWLIPLALLLVFQFVDSFVLADLYKAEQITAMQESFERHDIPEAQREKAMEQVESGTGFFASPVFLGAVRGIGIVAVGLLLPALLYLVGVNFVLGGRARFADLVTVVCLVALIPLARDVVLMPVKRTMETIHVSTGPAALISDKRSSIHYLASLFDLVNLYSFVPLALGLRMVGQIRSGQAWGIVIAVYALAALVGFGFLRLGQMA